MGSLEGAVDVNGAAAAYPALNSPSITVEYWARTNEGQAQMVGRATGGDANNDGTDGFNMRASSALRLTYWVDNGAGGSTMVAMAPLHDFGANWDHAAFTYDAASGVGTFYVNGISVGSNDGPDNRPLVWGAGVEPLRVGTQADGGPGFSTTTDGYFDEVRISNVALTPERFLNGTFIPEPSSIVLALLGAAALGLAGWRARRR